MVASGKLDPHIYTKFQITVATYVLLRHVGFQLSLQALCRDSTRILLLLT